VRRIINDNHPSIMIESSIIHIIHHPSSISSSDILSVLQDLPIIKPGVERHGGQLDPHGTGLQCPGNPVPWLRHRGPNPHLGMVKTPPVYPCLSMFKSYKHGDDWGMGYSEVLPGHFGRITVPK
jgi:hypothetical protein